MRGCISIAVFSACRVLPLRALPVIKVNTSVPNHLANIADSLADPWTGRYEIIRRDRKDAAALYGFQKVVLLPKLLDGRLLCFRDHFHVDDDVGIATDHVFQTYIRIRNSGIREDIRSSGKFNQFVQR